MSLIKKLVLILLFSFSTLFAKENLYFLPDQSKEFYKEFKSVIQNAKNSIKLAVYNISDKRVFKLLKEKANEDVSVSIKYDAKKLDDSKPLQKLCKKRNVQCTSIDKQKQHIKLIIIDNKTALFGSINLTKKSFKENYELIYLIQKDKIVNQLLDIYKKIE